MTKSKIGGVNAHIWKASAGRVPRTIDHKQRPIQLV